MQAKTARIEALTERANRLVPVILGRQRHSLYSRSQHNGSRCVAVRKLTNSAWLCRFHAVCMPREAKPACRQSSMPAAA